MANHTATVSALSQGFIPWYPGYMPLCHQAHAWQRYNLYMAKMAEGTGQRPHLQTLPSLGPMYSQYPVWATEKLMVNESISTASGHLVKSGFSYKRECKLDLTYNQAHKMSMDAEYQHHAISAGATVTRAKPLQGEHIIKQKSTQAIVMTQQKRKIERKVTRNAICKEKIKQGGFLMDQVKYPSPLKVIRKEKVKPHNFFRPWNSSLKNRFHEYQKSETYSDEISQPSDGDKIMYGGNTSASIKDNKSDLHLNTLLMDKKCENIVGDIKYSVVSGGKIIGSVYSITQPDKEEKVVHSKKLSTTANDKMNLSSTRIKTVPDDVLAMKQYYCNDLGFPQRSLGRGSFLSSDPLADMPSRPDTI